MTKVEAVFQWRKSILPLVKKQESGKADLGMRTETWAVYIDDLRKDGHITEKQYHEWLPPIECRPPRSF